MEENIECGGFTFYNNFDSANLAKVEKVEINKTDNGKGENNKSHKNCSSNDLPSYEFNLWTKYDCHGTEYQNNNKTWFYFGIKAATPGVHVKLNLVNLNKQVKMFSQGMSPVYKVIPGHPQWERIRERPSFTADDKNNDFILSFNYRASDNPNATTYFAFTYPFSYTDLQNHLKKIDSKMSKQSTNFADDIYYHRECAIHSLEGRRLDVLTISSYYNILPERETRLKDLFPVENELRPFKFRDKKIIFISARVHPGETPSSFVLNGFLNLLLNREDQIAVTLRRLYVFKLIPMLNPDGVAQGYYRMDTRGVNLNRLYLNPLKSDHPTIFAAKALLIYYHTYHLPETQVLNSQNLPETEVPELEIKNTINAFDNTPSNISSISDETNKLLQRVTLMSLEEKNKRIEQGSRVRNCLLQATENSINSPEYTDREPQSIESCDSVTFKKLYAANSIKESPRNPEDSGIFLYVDFHGHASKKGIFMYGNHFDDPEDASACLLLPKLISINNSNFHFTSCNFAEKNMYIVDKRDGLSREGSGRVAVYKLFGLINSYTLECNYNTGRLVNAVPAKIKEGLQKVRGQVFVPPKYNPAVFEEVGAALGPSILDMTGDNPNSRLPNSQYRTLKGLKSYLKLISNTQYPTTLNKPLNKNNSGDRFRYSQDSASSETDRVMFKTASKCDLLKNSRKIFRAVNIYGTIHRMKNNKRPHQTIKRSVQKIPALKKVNNRETETHKSPPARIKDSKSKLATPSLNKINITKLNIFGKNQVAKKMKIIDKGSRIKIVKRSLMKKSVTIVKRTVKEPGMQKTKSNTLSKVRHNLQTKLGEVLKKSIKKNVSTVPNKQKNKKNFSNKKKNLAAKTKHRNSKNSSK